MSATSHLQGLSVLVLGLGDSGAAMVRWCHRQGAAMVAACDSRAEPPQAVKLKEAFPGLQVRQGFDLAWLDGVQLVLKSPGLSPLDPGLSPLLAEASARGIPVWGELSLFAEALREMRETYGYAPKILAITGTNGKTTTTSMTAQLIERAGFRVAMAGNIGPTLMDTLTTGADQEPWITLAEREAAKQAELALQAQAKAEADAERQAQQGQDGLEDQASRVDQSPAEADAQAGETAQAQTEALAEAQAEAEAEAVSQPEAQAPAQDAAPNTAQDAAQDAEQPAPQEDLQSSACGPAAPDAAADQEASLATSSDAVLPDHAGRMDVLQASEAPVEAGHGSTEPASTAGEAPEPEPESEPAPGAVPAERLEAVSQAAAVTTPVATPGDVPGAPDAIPAAGQPPAEIAAASPAAIAFRDEEDDDEDDEDDDRPVARAASAASARWSPTTRVVVPPPSAAPFAPIPSTFGATPPAAAVLMPAGDAGIVLPAGVTPAVCDGLLPTSGPDGLADCLPDDAAHVHPGEVPGAGGLAAEASDAGVLGAEAADADATDPDAVDAAGAGQGLTGSSPPAKPVEDPAQVDRAILNQAAQAKEIAKRALAALNEGVLPEGGGPPPHLVPPPPKGPEFELMPEFWVLELSSFQLEGVENFEPTAATVLNVTQDHLDWHGSLKAYADAKARIFGRQGILVINRDDPMVEAMVPAPEVIKGAKGRPARTVHRQQVRFGLDAPSAPGDYGLVVENGMAWLVRAREQDETLRRKKDEEVEIQLQRLMPADALRIRGRHNASNALAALALATSAGVQLAPMLHGLREYRGEPHRVEYVATIRGVDHYDDSKGTNVGATVAALKGLGEDKLPHKLVVILGGDGKGQDFKPLAEPLARYCRAVAFIGRDAQAMDDAVGDRLAMASLPSQHFATLEEATRWAQSQALPGDAVLLSPACASLDMFRNYAHRAQVYVDTVQAISEEEGLA